MLMQLTHQFRQFKGLKLNMAGGSVLVEHAQGVRVNLRQAGVGKKALVDGHMAHPVHMGVAAFFAPQFAYGEHTVFTGVPGGMAAKDGVSDSNYAKTAKNYIVLPSTSTECTSLEHMKLKMKLQLHITKLLI